VQHVDGDLGELLAQPYVREKFAGDSRARATELGKEILAAMRTELDALPWMDAPTRAAAKAKLDQMIALVGYPDTWRAYPFAIARTDYAGNRRAATRFELARQLAKIGKPVDHKEWAMTPPTVNAYYDSSLNRLVVAAGELQPPFFGAKFHPAVNFGSAGGGTFGHEMTHGFDDEGSQFDGAGNLKVWWTPATTAKFAAATTCIADQYSQYEAVPKVHLDGKLTAGENIADNGGVKLGYLAYQAWRARQATPVQRDIEGTSDDQLYFLAYGQSWCEKTTAKALETQAHSNPHSPAKWRVDGVIPNQPGFGAAFKCAEGTPMNPGPAKACSIW
jgi:predicted metalloendopeptidase